MGVKSDPKWSKNRIAQIAPESRSEGWKWVFRPLGTPPGPPEAEKPTTNPRVGRTSRGHIFGPKYLENGPVSPFETAAVGASPRVDSVSKRQKRDFGRRSQKSQTPCKNRAINRSNVMFRQLAISFTTSTHNCQRFWPTTSQPLDRNDKTGINVRRSLHYIS